MGEWLQSNAVYLGSGRAGTNQKTNLVGEQFTFGWA